MPKASTPTYCGYIDLLGTRVMAKSGAQTLLEGLDKFHTALDSAYTTVGKGTCYAFSDGAFFTFDAIEDFIKLYKQTRNELFEARHFFRCSFLEGDIDVIESGKMPEEI